MSLQQSINTRGLAIINDLAALLQNVHPNAIERTMEEIEFIAKIFIRHLTNETDEI